VIFGISHAQNKELLITKQRIDIEIEKVKDISLENPQTAIDLADRIYKDSKQIGYKKGMLESHVIRMGKYYNIGSPEKILELSKEAEMIAAETKDNEALCMVYRLKGQAYDQLAFFDKCRKELERSMTISEKITSANAKNYNQALIYMGIASYTAHINSPVDSVMHYQSKALESVEKIDESKEYLNQKYYLIALSYINLSMTNSALSNFQVSERLLAKALDICRDKQYNIGKRPEVLALNEFAWLYYTRKKFDKSIEYALQAESLEKQILLPYIRRDIYEVLFKSYVEMGNKTAASKYTKLFTSLNDSIVNAEKIAIEAPVGQIVKEEKAAGKSNVRKILAIATGVILLVIICGWFLFKRKQERLREKYEAIINKLEQPEQKTITPAEKSIILTDETLNDLLVKLKKFEESRKFLRNDMNLTYLANSLNTNTRYLSEVINQQKGKNFYNYLNGLRIQYITDLLYREPKYREYKVSYLAEVCGFTSREVFSVIFKKETGMTPSYFINNLRKEDRAEI